MAKKFNFRLEPVLKIRKHKVEQAKEELNQIVSIRIKIDKEIKENEEYLAILLNKKIKSAKAADIQTKLYHKNYIEDEIKRLKKEREQILEIENLKRHKLSLAMKDEKILDKLKQKQFENYNLNLEQEEQKSIDEIAIKQFTKNNKDNNLNKMTINNRKEE